MKLFNLAIQSLIFTLYLLGVSACQPNNSDKRAQNISVSRSETQLLLNNAILEQHSERDNTSWKIKAESIVYSKNKQTAQLKVVTGNLLQDGDIILQISAETGEVRDNGNLILLNDNIIASDPRNGSIVRSNSVEWRPQANLLIARQNLRGTHANLEVTATEGRYFTDRESLELQGQVVATTRQSNLQLTSDRLIWDIPQNTVTSPGNIQIVRYQDEATITDRLVADRGKIDLGNNIATLSNNIEFNSLNPRLQLATQTISWNYQKRIANSQQPIQIIDRDRQLDITGNQGEIDFTQNIARLQGGVRGINHQDSAQLYAQAVIWYINTKVVEATGNVVYRQSDPQVNLTGEKAVGTLEDGNIVVSGNQGTGKQVKSTINN